MVLSCSGPNTLALLNKQLSNSSFSLFFSCHAAPFLDKCFFTRQTHVTDWILIFWSLAILPNHSKNKQDQILADCAIGAPLSMAPDEKSLYNSNKLLVLLYLQPNQSFRIVKFDTIFMMMNTILHCEISSNLGLVTGASAK